MDTYAVYLLERFEYDGADWSPEVVVVAESPEHIILAEPTDHPDTVQFRYYADLYGFVALTSEPALFATAAHVLSTAPTQNWKSE